MYVYFPINIRITILQLLSGKPRIATNSGPEGWSLWSALGPEVGAGAFPPPEDRGTTQTFPRNSNCPSSELLERLPDHAELYLYHLEELKCKSLQAVTMGLVLPFSPAQTPLCSNARAMTSPHKLKLGFSKLFEDLGDPQTIDLAHKHNSQCPVPPLKVPKLIQQPPRSIPAEDGIVPHSQHQ